MENAVASEAHAYLFLTHTHTARAYTHAHLMNTCDFPQESQLGGGPSAADPTRRRGGAAARDDVTQAQQVSPLSGLYDITHVQQIRSPGGSGRGGDSSRVSEGEWETQQVSPLDDVSSPGGGAQQFHQGNPEDILSHEPTRCNDSAGSFGDGRFGDLGGGGHDTQAPWQRKTRRVPKRTLTFSCFLVLFQTAFFSPSCDSGNPVPFQNPTKNVRLVRVSVTTWRRH